MSDTDFSLSQKEAADFLQVSTKSISRYRKRGLPHKLVLNPMTGKQEVRFRRADLERWDEGRQLLATYGRDGEGQSPNEMPGKPDQGGGHISADSAFLPDLLAAYREQIALLREQLEDMRGQLARRDRQIDDLMRLMVGLQLEYKPLPGTHPVTSASVEMETQDGPAAGSFGGGAEVYQPPVIIELGPPTAAPGFVPNRKTFRREQLAASILQLRRKGKSWEEIALGLNRIGAATLSGRAEWTASEVMALLPPLVSEEVESEQRGQ
jgi:hypothetical protein